MKYKNTKTGAIIDSSCVIKGGDWIKYDEETEDDVTGKEAEDDVTDEDYERITVKEIKQELDAFGIKYNPKARKQELYDLMLKGR